MHGTPWVLIDTETDGIDYPIHVVELAGQLMHGWEPVGPPFQMLLNHDVPISARVSAIHGYTREHLRRHGHPPAAVYEAFRAYAGDLPLVAHNLAFDWDRVLRPEWARLNIAPVGRRGFCCLMTARRLALESRRMGLGYLKAHYALTDSLGHRALNDVLTMVELFSRVYRPRLESAGLTTFDAVARFTARTPVASCTDLIRRALSGDTGNIPSTARRVPSGSGYGVRVPVPEVASAAVAAGLNS